MKKLFILGDTIPHNGEKNTVLLSCFYVADQFSLHIKIWFSFRFPMVFFDECLQGEMEKLFVVIVASLRGETYTVSYSCSLFIPSFWIGILTKQMP